MLASWRSPTARWPARAATRWRRSAAPRACRRFAEAAEKVIAIHREAWKDGGKSAKQWRASLAEYAYPRIGDRGVDSVATADVMAVLLPIWTRKQETAQRVRRRIGAIMKWAVAQGYRTDNPAGEALAEALPKRPARVRHMAALPHGEVAGAIAAVRGSSAWIGTKLAFEFLVLTAARSSEVRLATWDEIDLVALVWTIPVERMKAQREHRVPLCGRAVEVLREAVRPRGVSTRDECRQARVSEHARPSAHRREDLEARQESRPRRRCRTASGRLSGTGPRNGRTIRGRSSRRRLRTRFRIGSRRPTRGQTCSSAAAG